MGDAQVCHHAHRSTASDRSTERISDGEEGSMEEEESLPVVDALLSYEGHSGQEEGEEGGVVWGDDEDDQEDEQRRNTRTYRCHVCQAGFWNKQKLFKHYAVAFGHFEGGAYPDHVKHLWSERLTPELLPSTGDPLYHEIINFIRNLQYDYRIRRVNDPGSLPRGTKLFEGTTQDRIAFESRTKWKEDDPRLKWPTQRVPFSGDCPDGVVLSSGSLVSSGSFAGRGRHRGSVRNVSERQACRHSDRHGWEHDVSGEYDPCYPDADDRDDAADGCRVRSALRLDESRLKTDDAVGDITSCEHASILLKVCEGCWVVQGCEILHRDDGHASIRGGVFKQSLAVVTLLRHHEPTSIEGWQCTCEDFRINVSVVFTSGESHSQICESPIQGQEIKCENDEITSLGRKAPCLHVQCVVHESQSGVSQGKHHPVHNNVNYHGCSVVPICLFESDSEPYANRCTTPGHPPAYMFSVRDDGDSDSESICVCKVQKDKGKMIVRCTSSSRHSSLKSQCCIAARDFFNLHATTITGLMTDDAGPAILRAELPPVKHAAAPSNFETQFFRRNEGYHPAEQPHSIKARKNWYERESDTVHVTIDCHDGERNIPKLVTLKRASPTVPDDSLVREERVRFAIVWGQQHAVRVKIVEWLVKEDGKANYLEDIPGIDLGLFRFSATEYFDAGMLYDFLWMSSSAGKMTMQAFHERMLSEYDSFVKSEFPQGSPSEWIEFPSNTKFNAVIHSFKIAHEYNQNKFLKHVDVCPWCEFNSNIQIWDGTFRFMLSKYLDKEFSVTFFDQDFNCDPDDREGSVRRRCLQSLLHPPPEDRRTDAEFSLLTCKPSQFHPVGYEQMGMIQSMVSCVAGVSVHSSDGAEDASSTQRSGQGQGKRSRPGGAKDAPRCKIPRYEWAGDDDYEKMYKMQGRSNHPFGPELTALCDLFRKKSPLVHKGTGVPEILLLVAHDMSLQAVVTFNMMPVLEHVLGEPITVDDVDGAEEGSSILEEKLRGIGVRLTKATKQHLGSFIGNPEVVQLLTSVVDCIPRFSTEEGLIHDCAVVVSFLFYLVDCVKLSVTRASRERIIEAAGRDPKRPCKLRACPSGCSAPDSCEHCSYSKEGFEKYGEHYMGVKKERGRYPKDKKSAAEREKKDQEQGCEKDFEKGRSGSMTSGGIVTACCPHGICQGFHVLVNCEGRNDIFTVLVERYEVPPLLIGYDFGCALREFCLNRCPEFFALTLFKIDRYHEFNHSSSVCSRANHLSMHKDLEWMNSQTCEQLNAHLEACMKGRTEQYNKRNYLNTVRLWIRSWNARKIKTLTAGDAWKL